MRHRPLIQELEHMCMLPWQPLLIFFVAMATVSERFMLFLDNMLNFIIIFYNPQSFINIGKVIQKKFINVAFRYRKL